MERLLNKNLKENVGKQVLVKGWMHTLRKMGKINFLVIRDRSGLVQVVIEEKEQLEKIKNLKEGSILHIEATVQESNQTELGIELINPVITVTSEVTETPPVEINKEELNAHIDTILDYRPITLRHQRYQAIFRIQATIVKAYREFLTSQGFTEFFGPSIIGASSEGGTEMFNVEYFDQKVLLSQSAQLYKQMMVGVYERVFALMKCFRAEKSNTRRHLTEATQFEFEMGFIESFEDVMNMLERVVKYIVQTVNEENASDLKILGVELAKAPEEVSFPRISFRDALELFYKRTGIDERGENDLSPAAEKELCAYAREEFGTDFIFVTHFLREKVAFYAKPNEEDPTVANYFDLLCREIEIVSGGQRIDKEEEMIESLKLKGLNPENFTDYLSIFKYGMPKHGGFGMGMERLTMMLLGIDNIRHTTLFPSDPRRVASVRLQPKVYAGSELTEKIMHTLNEEGIKFEHLTHEATKTSEESAQIRNMELSDGVKAIILRGKKSGTNIMVCLPANEKVDMQAISKLEGEKFEFEKPETIQDKFGREVGGVPPFGNYLGLKTYFSEQLAEKEQIGFNIDLTESILMNIKDLIKIVEPEMI
ncbi:aspartate--tRNA(Asn) ligase [Candidatus Dojkabacteria bacterium]|uniref:Aspartate--tRNA ligase n=1 Tax=Candidatus Dojkabacteria bacterium TaxID=2099670 RepID=A0A955L5I3_9BACT|nr:aspartate--tRNA(Asn) ligase [Candidatus Dojkabacteria bacterium]